MSDLIPLLTWTVAVCAFAMFIMGLLLAASNGDDCIEAWQQGREYGHAEMMGERRRALELRPVATLQVDAPMYDWETTDEDIERCAAELDEIAQRFHAKAKHPSNWTEAHADRGPWTA